MGAGSRDVAGGLDDVARVDADVTVLVDKRGKSEDACRERHLLSARSQSVRTKEWKIRDTAVREVDNGIGRYAVQRKQNVFLRRWQGTTMPTSSPQPDAANTAQDDGEARYVNRARRIMAGCPAGHSRDAREPLVPYRIFPRPSNKGSDAAGGNFVFSGAGKETHAILRILTLSGQSISRAVVCCICARTCRRSRVWTKLRFPHLFPCPLTIPDACLVGGLDSRQANSCPAPSTVSP